MLSARAVYIKLPQWTGSSGAIAVQCLAAVEPLRFNAWQQWSHCGSMPGSSGAIVVQCLAAVEPLWFNAWHTHMITMLRPSFPRPSLQGTAGGCRPAGVRRPQPCSLGTPADRCLPSPGPPGVFSQQGCAPCPAGAAPAAGAVCNCGNAGQHERCRQRCLSYALTAAQS